MRSDHRFFLSIACQLIAVIALSLLIGCGRGPYDDLEDSFQTTTSLSAPPIPTRTAYLVGKKYRGAFNYQDVFAIRLSPESIHMLPSSSMMKPIVIPSTAVTACSARSYGEGRWEARLLLGELGIDISIPRAPEIIDWCWQNRIPAASGAEAREWQYENAPLPSRDVERKEFESRDAYDERIRQASLGY